MIFSRILSRKLFIMILALGSITSLHHLNAMESGGDTMVGVDDTVTIANEVYVAARECWRAPNKFVKVLAERLGIIGKDALVKELKTYYQQGCTEWLGRSIHGNTALLVAVDENNHDVVEVLLKAADDTAF